METFDPPLSQIIDRIDDALRDLNAGRRIRPIHVAGILEKARRGLETRAKRNLEIAQEQLPVRTVVANWNLGVCKRCLENGVADGDVIVKVYGKGWWHDACFRVVRPEFYVGL